GVDPKQSTGLTGDRRLAVTGGRGEVGRRQEVAGAVDRPDPDVAVGVGRTGHVGGGDDIAPGRARHQVDRDGRALQIAIAVGERAIQVVVGRYAAALVAGGRLRDREDVGAVEWITEAVAEPVRPDDDETVIV